MSAVRFSANTGYLWKELPFLDRIGEAARHGFDGVEFHDEAQTVDRSALHAVLAQTRLPVFGLNVRMGDTFGCAAIPDKRDMARRDIDDAVELAQDISAGAIHILAGVASGQEAYDTYLDNLRYALSNSDRVILIEPVSNEQLPGYFLRTIEQAAGIISQIAHPRLRILFDCYHIHREHGDVRAAFQAHVAQIGHVQIAAVENRGEPLPGVLDYSFLLPEFQNLGYSGPFGCEYRPVRGTTAGLTWMKR